MRSRELCEAHLLPLPLGLLSCLPTLLGGILLLLPAPPAPPPPCPLRLQPLLLHLFDLVVLLGRRQ